MSPTAISPLFFSLPACSYLRMKTFFCSFARKPPWTAVWSLCGWAFGCYLYGGQDPRHLPWLPPPLPTPPGRAAHGTKPRKEALGVEPGLWPPVSMCSLSGLTYTAPELTDSLACARGRQVSEECNGKVGWGTWSPENTGPPRALWAPANYCLLRMQARDPDSMGNFIVV